MNIKVKNKLIISLNILIKKIFFLDLNKIQDPSILSLNYLIFALRKPIKYKLSINQNNVSDNLSINDFFLQSNYQLNNEFELSSMILENISFEKFLGKGTFSNVYLIKSKFLNDEGKYNACVFLKIRTCEVSDQVQVKILNQMFKYEFKIDPRVLKLSSKRTTKFVTQKVSFLARERDLSFRSVP